jgi:Possible hemagglutinin (DUF637)
MTRFLAHLLILTQLAHCLPFDLMDRLEIPRRARYDDSVRNNTQFGIVMPHPARLREGYDVASRPSKDLTSRHTIKNIAVNALAAGLTGGVNTSSFQSAIVSSIQTQLITAGLRNVVCKEKFDIKDVMKSAVIQGVAAFGAGQISAAKTQKIIDGVGKTACHTLLGAGIGYAMQGNAQGTLSGAVAGFVTAASMEIMIDGEREAKLANGDYEVLKDNIKYRAAVAEAMGVIAGALANQGDIAKVMKDLGRRDTIKNIAVNALAAGLTGGVNTSSFQSAIGQWSPYR